MTKTTITLKLECAGRELILGPGSAADVTRVTGLESSDVTVGMSDLAAIDGASMDGVHIGARPIHIEASYKTTKDTEGDREQLIRFFAPKAKGLLTATIGKRSRVINYYLDGWALKERRTLDVRVGFTADLICPDPYFRSAEDIEVSLTPGLAIPVENNGDVPVGWTATIRGEARGPSIFGENLGAMHVEAGIADGDELVISTEPRARSVMLNGTSVFALLDPSSVPFQIPVGGGYIAAMAEDGQDRMSAVLRYRERFFGI